MKGRYTGWLTGDFSRIGPYDQGERCFFGIMPDEKRTWAAQYYGFRNAKDTQEDGTNWIYEVHLQQILEAINERREAVRLYVPHYGVTTARWNNYWRALTWQDVTNVCTADETDFCSIMNVINFMRNAIHQPSNSDFHSPYNFDFCELNPWLNPLAYYFCYPIDGDVDGINWDRFEKEYDLLMYAMVGAADNDGDQAYTFEPPRLSENMLGQYVSRPALLDGDTVTFCCEHLNELKLCLNKLEYLYPTIGFDLVQSQREISKISDCRDTWSNADIDVYVAGVWDETEVVFTNVRKKGWPEGSYRIAVPPPGYFECKMGKTAIQVSTQVDYWWPTTLEGWDVLVAGNWKNGDGSITSWNPDLDYNQKETGAELVAKLSFGSQPRVEEWGWNVTNARKYIEFDYKVQAVELPVPEPM